MTVNNIGGGAATFQLLELDKGSVPFGSIEQSPPLVQGALQDTADALSLNLPPGPVMDPLAAGDIIQSWATGMATPWGIAFDGPDGTVWIAHGWGRPDAVKEFAPDGTATGRQWPYSWPTTNGPGDMTYNWNTGMLWTMNINTGVSNCIYEIDPNSGPTGNTICPGGGTGFSISQRGLAYDPATDTWFAGSWNDLMIHRFDSTGTILSSVNVGIAVAGLAYNPIPRRGSIARGRGSTSASTRTRAASTRTRPS